MNIGEKRIGRLTATLLLATASVASAQPLWHDTSLTLLYGDGFEVNHEEQATVTLEHASGWGFGDLFLFMDYTNYQGGNLSSNGFYGEFSPRFSLAKLSDWEPGDGVLQDVLLATTVEFGKGDVETLLVGPGFDLKLPGFDRFQLNLYHRFPEGGGVGETIQITPVWSISTPFAGSELIFDGFMDWNVNSDGLYTHNLHFNPQLKYDLGRRFGLGKRKLLVGLEYSYWRNKYGIRDSAFFDTDQSVVSLLLKAHF